MAVFRERAEHRPAGGVCLLLLLMILCQSGCGGCRKTPDEQEKQQAEEKAKKKEKEKEPFEYGRPAVMPSAKDFAGFCKPGHWISQVWPDVKANRGDFQGELQTEITDFNSRKLPLVGVPYEMTSHRPAILAKGQPKSLETCTWIPPRQEARSVNFKLAAGGGGPAVIDTSMVLSRMPSYQYFFVVLSQPASRYEYLDKRLASIHQHPAGPTYYKVVSMPAGAPGTPGRRPSLPTSALCWTSIAYLLWDDFDPAQWDVDQQQALIDWLHWGGQIIVSGPDALERLHNSFLRSYLPATVKQSRTFSADDLAELSYWAGEGGAGPRPVKPWAGAVLEKEPNAEFLPRRGNLLVERQVGRGRIVASAFRLTGPELTGWAGYDCLFNACLLRRPAREFPAEQGPADTWLRWVGSKEKLERLDAAQMTAVRYFARDAGVECKHYASDIITAKRASAETTFFGDPRPTLVNQETGIPLNGDEDAPIPPDEGVAPGLGAWNDFSPVAQAARKAVRDAAGISVPERRFVVWVVVGYLCVLVPGNWLVFRLLGRVEWAWFAAPLIAIACTLVVIQQAQLNIGFARSRNEIAVIEMQPGYSRAHVARYMELYTSLSTRYEFHLDDPGGQILPFPRADSLEEAKKFRLGSFDSMRELVCRRGDDTQLTGFRVNSNAEDFVHSEEMEDFGGTVTLHQDGDEEWRVTNGTKYRLEDCQAVRGGEAGRIDVAKIGRLDPGATVPLMGELGFVPYPRGGKAPADNTKDGLGGPSYQRPHGSDPSGELSVEGVADVALKSLELRSGEFCLVARVADDVPGLTVTPVAQQTRQAALLVAHLDAGPLQEPERDTKAAVSSLRALIPKPLSSP